MAYFVYILQSQRDDSYYIVSTQNLTERLQRHNQGRSQYTKSKRPWILVYSEKHLKKSVAIKKESLISSLFKNFIFLVFIYLLPSIPFGLLPFIQFFNRQINLPCPFLKACNYPLFQRLLVD